MDFQFQSLTPSAARKLHTVWQTSPYFGNIVIFSLTEFLFMALGMVLYFVVVTLPVASTNHRSILKGAMTVLLVAWHTIALAPVYAIVAFVYSSEWLNLYRDNGNQFIPGTTDRLSTLTSSWIVRARYMLSYSPSWPFHLCFLAATLAPGLASLGSSGLMFADYYRGYDIRLDVANISFQTDLIPGDGGIVSFERSVPQNTSFIWNETSVSPVVPIDHPVFVPLPRWTLLKGLSYLESINYTTDVAKFHTRCE